MKADANLDESCSHGYFLDSICNFNCSKGYVKVGAASSTCVQTNEGVHWSSQAPVCNPGKFHFSQSLVCFICKIFLSLCSKTCISAL